MLGGLGRRPGLFTKEETSMLAYLRAVWACRYFWLALVWMDLRLRYRGSVLGLGWSLLHPLVMTALFCLVFGAMLRQDICFYAPYVMVGLICWTFLQQVTLQGCQCFLFGERYIRQYPTPLAIYPLRTALANGFHLLIALGAVVVLAWSCRGFPGVLPLLGVGAALVLLLCLGWSLAVLLGLVTLHFRDAQHLSEIGLQILFYLTPVLYPTDLLASRHLGLVVALNPLAPFLELVREPLLNGRLPGLLGYAQATLVVLVVAGLAAWALRRLEARVIFLL